MVAPSVPESNLSQRRQRCQNVVPKRRAPRNPTQPRVVRTFAAVMWGERQQTRRCPTSHWCSLRNAGNWLCAGRCRWLAVAITLAVTVAVDVVALLRCNPPLPAPVGPLIVAPAPSTAAAKPADRQPPCCLTLSPRPLCPPAPCTHRHVCAHGSRSTCPRRAAARASWLPCGAGTRAKATTTSLTTFGLRCRASRSAQTSSPGTVLLHSDPHANPTYHRPPPHHSHTTHHPHHIFHPPMAWRLNQSR